MLGRINWHPSRHNLRYFAVTLAIVAALLALVLVFGGKFCGAVWVGAVGVALSAVCYLIPPAGRIIYLVWMAVTFLLGMIVSPVVTAIIFYLLVTPIGLIGRVFGKDRLRLKKPKGATTYFLEYQERIDKESFRRQF
jgi:hypothetical protein